MMYRVCIDAGHGGTDPGAVNGALYEKDVVLEIAKNLRTMLLKAGYEVAMTRDKDIYHTPNQKAAMANKSEANIFISIHCNSAVSEQAHGTEVLIYNNDKLGACLQKRLVAALGTADRGVKVRKDLIVLNSTKMPAALIETAFISNNAEKHMLIKPEHRMTAARAIFNGINDYFGKTVTKVEEKSIEDIKAEVKAKFGFDENTMLYLEMYRYGEELLKRLAK